MDRRARQWRALERVLPLLSPETADLALPATRREVITCARCLLELGWLHQPVGAEG